MGEICSAISTNFEPVRERGYLPSPHMTASIYDCIIIVIAMTSKMHVSRVHVVRSWMMRPWLKQATLFGLVVVTDVNIYEKPTND